VILADEVSTRLLTVLKEPCIPDANFGVLYIEGISAAFPYADIQSSIQFGEMMGAITRLKRNYNLIAGYL
jgi:hypothetical protein